MKKFQKQRSKGSRSRRPLKRDIERLLSSGNYLAKGDIEEVVRLGEAGGLGRWTILMMR